VHVIEGTDWKMRPSLEPACVTLHDMVDADSSVIEHFITDPWQLEGLVASHYFQRHASPFQY
jgi:hypothetical protein